MNFCDITVIFCNRYADLARAYKDKEKESDKLRDVLAKTQDKALRKVCKEVLCSTATVWCPELISVVKHELNINITLSFTVRPTLVRVNHWNSLDFD